MAVGYHWSLRFFMNDNERTDAGCGRFASQAQAKPEPSPSQARAKPVAG
jgi:hypothetical protein